MLNEFFSEKFSVRDILLILDSLSNSTLSKYTFFEIVGFSNLLNSSELVDLLFYTLWYQICRNCWNRLNTIFFNCRNYRFHHVQELLLANFRKTDFWSRNPTFSFIVFWVKPPSGWHPTQWNVHRIFLQYINSRVHLAHDPDRIQHQFFIRSPANCIWRPSMWVC